MVALGEPFSGPKAGIGLPSHLKSVAALLNLGPLVTISDTGPQARVVNRFSPSEYKDVTEQNTSVGMIIQCFMDRTNYSE